MDEPPQRDLDQGGSYNFGSETDQSMYEVEDKPEKDVADLKKTDRKH